MPPKRRQSLTETSARSLKRRAQPKQAIAVDSDDEDLQAILAVIKQQEESEALARQLQAEWAANDQAPQAGPSRQDELIIIEDDILAENDEALARRLQAEWSTEDAVAGPPASGSDPASQHQSRASSATRGLDDPTSSLPNARLRAYKGHFIGTRQCSKCQADVPSPRGYVVYTSAQLPPSSLIRLLHAACVSCQTVYCRGCFKVLDCKPECRGKNSDANCNVVSCCTEIRAIALFEALGGFDRQYLGERAMSDSRAKETASKHRKLRVATVGPGGTGYSTGSTGSGYDYYGSGEDTHSWGPHAPRGRGRDSGRGRGAVITDHSTQATLAAHWDELLIRALKTATSLLPAPYAEDAQVYDMLPHSSTAQLLQTSQLPELLASLLRNDSITDWTERSDLYNAMLLLLRRMADCELTLEVLTGERYKLASSGGLEEWMWGDAEIKWAESTDGTIIKAQPLYAYFQKLTKQSEAFLAGASQLLESGGEDAEVESMVQSLSLCGEIIATRDGLERAMQVLNKGPQAGNPEHVEPASTHTKGKLKGKGHDPSIDIEREYAAECERLAFAHVPFPQAANGTYTTFNYARELQQTANATRNPKDRLHLVKELAVTATSLPTGIWVRVDEVRNDAIKIIIAGPEGTPYAGGLFEFDCLLPLEYPHKPPLMHLRTTGGGSVRFNPNLYSCGKVCLSLLGTWPGRPEEQWSAKSTLLQVLVSIQSMILIELPWFNEPGRGQASKNSRASIEYNKELQANTLRWAINDWLDNENRDSIWADVIASHFITWETKIRQCISDWDKSNPRIRTYTNGPPQPVYYTADAWSAYDVPPAPARGPAGMDLVAQFEQGMQKVKGWGLV